jgi:hypothetical protein
MDIKLFGYSISLNVIILIGILYLIMVVNALSGSCNREGMDNRNIQGDLNNLIENTVQGIKLQINDAERNGRPLTEKQIQNFSAQLMNITDIMVSKTNDPNIHNQIQQAIDIAEATVKGMVNDMQRRLAMQQSQPIPPIAQEQPIPQVPAMIEGRYIAPSAPLEPQVMPPMMPQVMPPMMPQVMPPQATTMFQRPKKHPMIQLPQGPPIPQGPPPKLSSFMNKLKKRF